MNSLYVCIGVALVMSALSSPAPAAAGCPLPTEKRYLDASVKPVVKPTASICVGGGAYSIVHHAAGRKTSLKWRAGSTVLHRIPRGFEPSLVGADKSIGFLPDHLQPHKDQKIVFYVSAIRSTGGNGSGQCGAGAEIFLHVLDLAPAKPKPLASHLIGSCSGIEIDESDAYAGELGDMSLVDGKLAMDFISYPGQATAAMATLSADFQKLEFIARKTH